MFHRLPTPASGLPRATDAAPPPRTWFRTRAGHRYGWEIAAIIVVKLVLLMLLWLLFIKPFPRPVMPTAAVIQQFYLPAAPSPHHD